YKTGYGHHIRVDCGDGVTVLYAHCSDIFVTKGQSVAAGQVIAEVGATGRVTGAHLHLGVLVNGKEVNPREYIS
ncbi:MAG: M23 family metallopeptidase, partial [Parabacteroides sp.]|nr:M23 family metallopeptidase [Parabacteroides sp.]